MTTEDDKYGKYNPLAVAIAFTVTGLIVFYLPAFADKSLNWRTGGHICGISLALIGVIFILTAISALTHREGLVKWAIGLILAAISVGIAVVLRKTTPPVWVAILLIGILILVIFVGLYALASGFASFFEDVPIAGDWTDQERPEPKKEISWYEKITLLIAVVSAIATIAATIIALFR